MPTEAEIQSEREQLYESSALRDDIFDDEASLLLAWGEQQVIRLAGQDGEFEQLCRFLRQLLKHINRFVGQREFLDAAGQQKYMEQVAKWLPGLGLPALSVEQLLSALPPQPSMAADLRAILDTLTPPQAEAAAPAPAPVTDQSPEDAEPTLDQAADAPVADTEDNTDSPDGPAPEDDPTSPRWRQQLSNRLNLFTGDTKADEQENDQ